ncbi:MAG: hypothetical protein ACE5HT_10465 [Gemmatimonadales bacterium]
MRTTLSLDPDVAAALERLRESDDRSFKALVNDLLRAGFEHMRREQRGSVHRTRGMRLGRCLLGSLDDVAETLIVAEGEHFQ